MPDSVAVAIVTRNADPWIDTLISSIVYQSRQPDAIAVVDDHSTDSTLRALRKAFGSRVHIRPSLSTATHSLDRIAQNFTQAVRGCAQHDVVVVSDHDDVWHPDRIAHQLHLLSRPQPRNALMVASDGRLVTETGAPLGGSLRTNFRLPPFDDTNEIDILRLTLTHLVATGSASAIRPSAFPDLGVPRGWLHDRWWSLVAAVRGGLVIDPREVIDYRVHGRQQAGLTRASHGQGARGKLSIVGPINGARKLADVRRLLLPQAASESLARELRVLMLAHTLGFLPRVPLSWRPGNHP